MMKISEESYARVNEILDDIGYVCDIYDYYEDWEEMARPSFATVMDELTVEQFDMTCAAIKEKIPELRDGGDNYARGIRMAFRGYLNERKEYLYDSGFLDKPDKPDDTEDEDEMNEYQEAMERYEAHKAYGDVVEKWLDVIGDMLF